MFLHVLWFLWAVFVSQSDILMTLCIERLKLKMLASMNLDVDQLGEKVWARVSSKYEGFRIRPPRRDVGRMDDVLHPPFPSFPECLYSGSSRARSTGTFGDHRL